MERCDFSSVITIINDHISESKRGNQSDLMYALFDTFATDEINIEETFDEGAVCRWVNGVRKISPKSAQIAKLTPGSIKPPRTPRKRQAGARMRPGPYLLPAPAAAGQTLQHITESAPAESQTPQRPPISPAEGSALRPQKSIG